MTMHPSPPDERLAAVTLDVLIRHSLVPSADGWAVQVAPGGSTDRTFSVLDPAGTPRLTVRLARPGLADRLRHEQRVLNELARAPQNVALDLPGEDLVTVAPAPCEITLVEDDALPERWLLSHEHMPGSPAPITDVSTAAREELGASLAWVHRHQRDGYMIWPSLDVQFGTRADAYHARLVTLRRYTAAQGLLPEADRLLDRLAGAELPVSAGWQETDFFLCHGDLSIGNILWHGESVRLIDWEFARDGDAAEDIAYLVAEQNLTPDVVAEIAEAYVDASGDPWAFARLPTWLPLVALDAALWWADYHLAQGEDPLAQVDVSSRLERASEFLKG